MTFQNKTKQFAVEYRAKRFYVLVCMDLQKFAEVYRGLQRFAKFADVCNFVQRFADLGLRTLVPRAYIHIYVIYYIGIYLYI